MKRLYSIAALAIVAALAIPSTAIAKDSKYTDKTGRFGLGYDSSLAAIGGLSARFQVAKNFGVQAIVGFDRIGVDLTDASGQAAGARTQDSFKVALRGDVGIAFTRRTSLSVIFGIDVFNESFTQEDKTGTGSVPAVDRSETRFAFETGVKAEHHFTDWFSVHGEVGFVFALITRLSEINSLFTGAGVDVSDITNADPSAIQNDSTAISDADGSVIRFGIGDTFGNFGFTFWFN